MSKISICNTLLTAFKADRKKALCKCCDRMINISNTGEFAFKSHMKSEMHKNNSRIGGEQAVTLSSFGFVSCGNGYYVEIVPVEMVSLNIVISP